MSLFLSLVVGATLLAILLAGSLKQKPRKPPPLALVGPAPYIGPATHTHSSMGTPYGKELPWQEATPDGHLAWAHVLLGSAPLDEGAGYFHNVGHEAVVLKTDLSPELVAASIATTSGLQGQVRRSGSYPNTYRWISYEVSSTESDDCSMECVSEGLLPTERELTSNALSHHFSGSPPLQGHQHRFPKPPSQEGGHGISHLVGSWYSLANKDEIVGEALKTSGLTHGDVPVGHRVGETAAGKTITLGGDGSRRLIPVETTVNASVASLFHADPVTWKTEFLGDICSAAAHWDVGNTPAILGRDVVSVVIGNSGCGLRTGKRTRKVAYSVTNCRPRLRIVGRFRPNESLGAIDSFADQKRTFSMLRHTKISGIQCVHIGSVTESSCKFNRLRQLRLAPPVADGGDILHDEELRLHLTN